MVCLFPIGYHLSIGGLLAGLWRCLCCAVCSITWQGSAVRVDQGSAGCSDAGRGSVGCIVAGRGSAICSVAVLGSSVCKVVL